MKLQEAIEILKTKNHFLKAVPLNSPLWKKAVLEFFNDKNLTTQIKEALITVAGSMEDEDVIRRHFEFFYAEREDNARKAMIEALKDNFHEKAVDLQLPLLGIRERVFDRYVRQVAGQNITGAIRFFLDKRPIRAGLFISKLRSSCLNDHNTFVRMNAAIILRNIGDKRALPDLEKRIALERKLLTESGDDVGVPYVIRELERSIAFFKERT